MSQQNDDFISFERALRDLQLQSEQLKKLVSEGEIRAFRDGDSMKFRREDLEALRGTRETEVVEEEELVFTDSLEDDTGMVTEELSDEDTLLADDDDEVVEEVAVVTPSPRAAASPRGARARAAEDEEKEPGWVTAVAILGTVVMLYGSMVCYNIAKGLPPGDLLAMFQPN